MVRTALIVDDDPDIRDMICVGLSAEGWKTQSTDSFYGAINILNQGDSIDCMILDYNLPGMPMEDFLEEVRKIAPKMQLILISAADRVVQKARVHRIKHYLGKPFNVEQLRMEVNRSFAGTAGK